jgi:hypothetical protein
MSREKVVARRATVRDIARKAGVSTATVSRVLNGGCPVKQEMRERVMTVLSREKYSINSNAAALGRLNAKKPRKRDSHENSADATLRQMAIADALEEIKLGTAAVAVLMREFTRLRQSIEALARSSGIQE